MLKRQDSYSSVSTEGSGVPLGIARHGSTSSLGVRSFRERQQERPRSGMRWEGRSVDEEEYEEGEEEEDDGWEDDRGERKGRVHHMATTMRGVPKQPPKQAKRKKAEADLHQGSMLSRGTLREGGGVRRTESVTSSTSSNGYGYRNNVRQSLERAGSVASDLGSIPERIRSPPARHVESPRQKKAPIHWVAAEYEEEEYGAGGFGEEEDEEALPPRRSRPASRIMTITKGTSRSPPPPKRQVEEVPPSPPPHPMTASPFDSIETTANSSPRASTAQRNHHDPPRVRQQITTTLNRRASSVEPQASPTSKPIVTHERSQSVNIRPPSQHSHTHFGAVTSEMIKHSPPPRSISPVKPALKNAHNSPGSQRNFSSDVSSNGSAPRKHNNRVSFSDEDSIASFSNYVGYQREALDARDLVKREKLPSFDSIRPPPVEKVEEAEGGKETEMEKDKRRTFGMFGGWKGAQNDPLPPNATSIPQPPSSWDEDEDMGPEPVMKSTAFTNEVPGFNLIQPTPCEEKQEPQPPTHSTSTHLTPDYRPPSLALPVGTAISSTLAVQPGETARFSTLITPNDESDSSDSDSIYADAYESLPAPPIELPVTSHQSIAKPVPAPPSPTPRDSPPDSPNPVPPPLPTNFSQPTPTPPHRIGATPPPKVVARQNSIRAPPLRGSLRDPPSPPQALRKMESIIPSRDSDGELSDSSFKRTHPRQRRTGGVGMRTSMRSEAEALPGTRVHLRRRFSSDSESDTPIAASVGQKKGGFLGFGRSKSTRGMTTAKARGGGGFGPSRWADSSDEDEPPQRGPMTAALTRPTTSSGAVSASSITSSPARGGGSLLRRLGSSGSKVPQTTSPHTATPPTGAKPEMVRKPTNGRKLQKRPTNQTRHTSSGTPAQLPIIHRASTPVLRVRSPVSGQQMGRNSQANGGRRSVGPREGKKDDAAAAPTAVVGGMRDGTVRGTDEEIRQQPTQDTPKAVKVKVKRKWWGGKKTVPVIPLPDPTPMPFSTTNLTTHPIPTTTPASNGAVAVESLALPPVIAGVEEKEANGADGQPERTQKAKKGKGWKRLIKKWS